MADPNLIDLQRKKASHIMHYLMERRQEQEYSDPFELLKNMQDVMLAYEPIEKKRASIGANTAK